MPRIVRRGGIRRSRSDVLSTERPQASAAANCQSEPGNPRRLRAARRGDRRWPHPHRLCHLRRRQRPGDSRFGRRGCPRLQGRHRRHDPPEKIPDARGLAQGANRSTGSRPLRLPAKRPTVKVSDQTASGRSSQVGRGPLLASHDRASWRPKPGIALADKPARMSAGVGRGIR